MGDWGHAPPPKYYLNFRPFPVLWRHLDKYMNILINHVFKSACEPSVTLIEPKQIKKLHCLQNCLAADTQQVQGSHGGSLQTVL